jgi:hypothetical protein
MKLFLFLHALTRNFKTTKNPDENPYLPIDFKNLKKKILRPKVSRLLSNVCDFQKES